MAERDDVQNKAAVRKEECSEEKTSKWKSERSKIESRGTASSDYIILFIESCQNWSVFTILRVPTVVIIWLVALVENTNVDILSNIGAWMNTFNCDSSDLKLKS